MKRLYECRNLGEVKKLLLEHRIKAHGDPDTDLKAGYDCAVCGAIENRLNAMLASNPDAEVVHEVIIKTDSIN